jgi:hypothetical protein
MVPDDDSAPEVHSHATGPTGREHDPRNGSDIETGARRQFSKQLFQGIWSATGRGKLLNPSKERTGDRLILTGPSPRSQGVDKA